MCVPVHSMHGFIQGIKGGFLWGDQTKSGSPAGRWRRKGILGRANDKSGGLVGKLAWRVQGSGGALGARAQWEGQSRTGRSAGQQQAGVGICELRALFCTGKPREREATDLCISEKVIHRATINCCSPNGLHTGNERCPSRLFHPVQSDHRQWLSQMQLQPLWVEDGGTWSYGSTRSTGWGPRKGSESARTPQLQARVFHDVKWGNSTSEAIGVH